MGAEGEPAPTPDVRDDAFREWLAALCGAHPSASKSLYLAADVLKAAKAAFVRCPQAAQQAELLRAYFDDRLQEDRYRKPFYRPAGQGRFFHDLEDVLAHAERWAREAGWGRKRKASKKADSSAPALSPEEAMSDAERAAFFEGLRGNLR